MEKIIKDTQTAMIMNTNMVNPPIVTLNKSVFEIPSQSLESFGEYGIKSKFWDDQHEDDDDEYWGAGFVGEMAVNYKQWIDQREYDNEEDLGI